MQETTAAGKYGVAQKDLGDWQGPRTSFKPIEVNHQVLFAN